MLKRLDRASKVAWCPSARYGSLIASGTIAGTIDDSFETRSQLELYDTDLGIEGPNMTLLGSVVCKDSFHSVAWGKKGIEDGRYSYGLLAGGMSDGAINIWDTSAIVKNQPNSLISRSELHKGQVLALEFHPQQVNLMASGSSDGEVYIWDLADPGAPKASPPHTQVRNHQPGVSAIAWNKAKSVPQIIASSNELGETTVWDLRLKRSIITFRQASRPAQVRTSAISWNPDASVQLGVSYIGSPIVEIWDLRHSMTPKTKLEGGHSNSVLSLDWCKHDANMLLTTGDDGRTILWNPTTGQMLTDTTSSGQTCFDIQWSDNIPSLYLSCSYDGVVGVHSQSTAGPAHVPKWHGRQVGATFGFGGKLCTFGLEPPPPAPAKGAVPAPVARKIKVTTLESDPNFTQLAAEFQGVLDSNNWVGLCDQKIGAAPSETERTTWEFMKILLQDPASQRADLLKKLGFEAPSKEEPVAEKKEAAAAAQQEQVPDDLPEAEDFFSSMASQPAESEPQPEAAEQKEPQETGPPPVNASESEEDVAIKQALVVGDFKSAVQLCIKADRLADAIVFSSLGGPQLWEETKATYFQNHKHGFVRNVLQKVVNQDLGLLVAESETSKWRETLAMLLTYAQGENYRNLVNQLAAKLESNDIHASLLCYLCASNVDKAVEIWSKQGDSSNPNQTLFYCIEKSCVLAKATKPHLPEDQSPRISALFGEYANLLVAQGCMAQALNFLQGSGSAESAVLMDRIFRSLPSEVQHSGNPPPFPFQAKNVNVHPAQAQALQLDMQQRQQAEYAQQQQQPLQQQQQPQQQQFGQRQQQRQQQQFGQQQQQRQQPGQQQFGQQQNQFQPQQRQQPQFNQPNRFGSSNSPAQPNNTFQPANQAPNRFQPNNTFQPPNVNNPTFPAPAQKQSPPGVFNPHANKPSQPQFNRPGTFDPNANTGGVQQPKMMGMPQPGAQPKPQPSMPSFNQNQPGGNRNAMPMPGQNQPSMPGFQSRPGAPGANLNQPPGQPQQRPGMPVPGQPQRQHPMPMPQPGMPIQQQQQRSGAPMPVPPGAPMPMPSQSQPQPQQQQPRPGMPVPMPGQLQQQQQPRPMMPSNGMPMPGQQQQPTMRPLMPSNGMPQPSPNSMPQPVANGMSQPNNSMPSNGMPPHQNSMPQGRMPTMGQPAVRPNVFQPQPSQPKPQPAVFSPPTAAAAPAAAAPAAAASPPPPLSGQGANIKASVDAVCQKLEGSPNIKPIEKKRLQDALKKLAALWDKLARNELSPACMAALQAMCDAMSAGDWVTAGNSHKSLVQNEWKDNASWIPVFKTIMLVGKRC